MGRPAIAEPDLLPFWNSVRELLLMAYGQSGRRNRSVMNRRAALARELGLEDVTVRAFLNGSQKTLGASPLQRLCAKCSDLEKLYRRHREQAIGTRQMDTQQLGGPQNLGGEGQVQLMLQLEGFESRIEPMKLKLRPGQETLVTIKVKAG
jgi:hypothetical protein